MSVHVKQLVVPSDDSGVRRLASSPPTWLLAVAVGVGYFALSRASLAMLDSTLGVASLWPASGFAVAALIMAGPRRWLPLAAAILVGNLVAQADVRGLGMLSLTLAAANALEPLMAAWLARRVVLRGPRHLGEVGEVLAIIAAAAAGALISSLIGAGSLVVALDLPPLQTLAHWWIADALGILVIAPMFLEFRGGAREQRAAGAAETVTAVGVSLALTAAIFLQHHHEIALVLRWPLMVLPPLVWVATRTGRRDIAFTLAGVGTLVAYGTARGRGPFVAADFSATASLLTAQVFVAALVACILLLAAFTARRRAVELRLSRSEVHHRTMVAHLPDTFISLYDTRLQCVQAEGELLRKLGYRATDFIGRSLQEGVPAAQYVQVLPAVREAITGTPGSLEVTSAEGHVMEVSVEPVREAGTEVSHVMIVTRDVTATRLAATELVEAEAFLRGAFEHAPVGMAVVGLDGRPEKVNSALVALTGRDRAELTRRTIDAITHPGDHADQREGRGWLLSGRLEIWSGEKRLLHAEGHTVPCATHVTLVRDADGAPRHFLMHVIDVTERKRFERQLQQMADHDPLTGLVNRRRFETDFADHLAAASVDAGALVLIDVDHFKAVNDSLGHAAGDQLLIDVGEALRRRLRGSDVLARLGGDEFAVLLPGASRVRARTIADDLLGEVRRLGAAAALDRPITLSIGITMCADHSTTRDAMRGADLALYAAKRRGRDQLCFSHDPQRTAEPTVRPEPTAVPEPTVVHVPAPDHGATVMAMPGASQPGPVADAARAAR